ncbi:MAG: hypothetical protein R2799_08605 [Crocinitomicaceae bacterium]
MNKVTLFAGLLLMLSCETTSKSISSKNEIPIETKYESIKENVIKKRNTFYSESYKRDAIRTYIFKTLKDSIFPIWKGTKWDFNGTTQTPQDGAIACGYFVMTTLQDVGFECDRVKFAQQASSKIIYAFSYKSDVKIFGNNDFKGFYTHVKKFKNDLFIVGLDNHVGFVINDEGNLFAVHSTAWPQGCVVFEPLEQSKVFRDSKVHYLGRPLNSDLLLKKWRVKETIPLQ